MSDILSDQSKTPTKGDAIEIFVRGKEVTCTVQMMAPGVVVIAKAPDGERIVAVPSRISENYWVDIHSPHDASKPFRWSHGDRQFEVGEFVDIDMQVDDDNVGKPKSVGVMRAEVLGVDAEGTRFRIRDCSLYADGEDQRLKEEKLASLMTSVTNAHVRGIDD